MVANLRQDRDMQESLAHNQSHLLQIVDELRQKSQTLLKNTYPHNISCE